MTVEQTGAGETERSPTTPDAPDSHTQDLQVIAEMPRDVGWFLLIGGFVSELGVPGVPPVWVFGLMILWPRLGYRVGRTLQRRAPKLFGSGLRMLCRYTYDLERRYPHRNGRNPHGGSRN